MSRKLITKNQVVCFMVVFFEEEFGFLTYSR